MLSDFIDSYTFQVILKSSVVLGIVSGMLGTFIMLKKESLLAGSASNASFLGVLVSFLITGAGFSYVAFIGAGVASLAVICFIKIISKHKLINKFLLQSLVISVSFGLCMAVLTYINRNGDTGRTGFGRFLLGEVATLSTFEVTVSLYICTASIIILILGLKQFKAILFDKDLAKTSHIYVPFYEFLFTLIFASVTIAGIQSVGILLMSGLFIAPAAGAKLWTSKFLPLLLLSGFLGGFSGAVGGVLSSNASGISAGPAIVGIASLIAILSCIFAPKRGLIWKRSSKV